MLSFYGLLSLDVAVSLLHSGPMAAVAQAGTTTAVGDDINSAAQQNAAKTGVNIEQKAKVSKATVKEVNAAVAAAAKPVDTKKPRKRKVVIGKSGKIFTLGQVRYAPPPDQKTHMPLLHRGD